MTIGLVLALFVAVLITVGTAHEWRDCRESWEHLGIRISPSYLRAIKRLGEPDDVHPYRTYVLRIYNPRTWPLWRVACRIERLVFEESDHNTAFELWWKGFLHILWTTLELEVDQRRVHATYDVPMGMMRNICGSVWGVPTFWAMRSKKYWHIKHLWKFFRQNGLAWCAAFLWKTMDINMVAVLREYRGKTDYNGHIPATLGLLAQTCQANEDMRVRWWFTVLQCHAFVSIQYETGRPWQCFVGTDLRWMSYEGSPPPGSGPFFSDFQAWKYELFTTDHFRFDRYFRDGMSSGETNWFAYAPRRRELRDPANPAGSARKRKRTLDLYKKASV